MLDAGEAAEGVFGVRQVSADGFGGGEGGEGIAEVMFAAEAESVGGADAISYDSEPAVGEIGALGFGLKNAEGQQARWVWERMAQAAGLSRLMIAVSVGSWFAKIRSLAAP